MSRFTQAAAALTMALLLWAPGCTGAQLEKVPDAEINQAHKAAAEQFGNKVMQAWARDEYPTVGAEAMDEFRKGHNDIDRQKAADKAIEQKFGNFKSMTLYEVKRTKPPKFEVYRFKGTFDKGTAEVRVTTDTDGKIGGHYILVWKDEM